MTKVALPQKYINTTLDDFKYMLERDEKEFVVYKSGILSFDMQISGGFAPGSSTMFPARSNSGKTMFVHKFTLGLLDNADNIVVISYALDDTRVIYYDRILAAIARIPIDHVQQRSLRTPETAIRLEKARETFQEKYMPRMIVYDLCDLRFGGIEGIEETVVNVYNDLIEAGMENPQIVLTIDSPKNIDVSKIQGLSGNENASNDYVSNGIKRICAAKSSEGASIQPIVIYTEHLRKLPLSIKRPGIDDVKGSNSSVYNATVVAIPWNDASFCQAAKGERSDMVFPRPDRNDPVTGLPVMDPVVELRVAKNKAGRMDYSSGASTMLFKMFQELNTLDEITDPTEYAGYANCID